VAFDRRQFVTTAASIAAAAAVRPAAALEIRPRASTADDPLGVRADFPILANGRTYLNAAYITPSPRAVTAAGAAFLQAKAERPMTVAELLAKAGEVRAQFARLINATPDEVGFVFATTEGENTVANNVPMSPGDNVVVDDLHYEGALVVHRELEKRRGIQLRIVRHRDGLVTARDIERHVDDRTRLVSVSLVSSTNGLRHDARALADTAHAHGALLHLDAIQALGTFTVDVRAMDTDFLCSGTYKGLLGGFGVAPFYIRRSLIDRVPIDRFGQFQVASRAPDHRFTIYPNARRYDYATLPFAEVYQLGAGLAYLERVGVARIEAHILGLTKTLSDGLVAQGHRLFTPADNRAAIVAFHYARPMAEVRAAFDAAKVDVTIREGHVRVSVGLFSNVEDIDRLLAVTQRLS
jgi:selenocysteine lyase/cysteine desulfurase